ncbi:MAG: VOC family protein [Opitutales bacterium]|jgi:predicted 3-demethylubiquinone-9 3-methyltransferase (glyoxalase superfamily)
MRRKAEQKVVPFLWFDGEAEEAMKFYVRVFKRAKITGVSRYGEAGPGKKGTVMSGSFEIEGQKFLALNGGPMFKFTPAISFYVYCDTQREVDWYWGKLSAGGKKVQCGWLGDEDEEKSARVMRALLKMKKLDIARLKRAYSGK